MSRILRLFIPILLGILVVFVSGYRTPTSRLPRLQMVSSDIPSAPKKNNLIFVPTPQEDGSQAIIQTMSSIQQGEQSKLGELICEEMVDITLQIVVMR